MRLRLLVHAVVSVPRHLRLTVAFGALATAGTLTPMFAVSAADAAAPPPTVTLRAPSVSLTAPTSVTRGDSVTLFARVYAGPAGLPDRPVRFVSRVPGSSTWHPLAEATTDANGTAVTSVTRVSAAREYGAYTTDLAELARSTTASTTVHVIDMVPVAPRVVGYNAKVALAGHLLQDATHGIAGQRVQVLLRSGPRSRWSAPTWVTTNRSGAAVVVRRFTHSFQIGVQFPGAGELAASPLAVASVTVKRPAAAAPAVAPSGFRFPFLNPGQVQSPGSWSLDQGVDMFAQGDACGAAAKLVAVGSGTVIQTGISGFGPTAPVIQMDAGPFKGRNVYYGHTGHIYVHVGQHVSAGQLVAQIGCGQVGYSAGPHLEIGVGEPGGPPCCPPMHATAGQMYRQLVAALRR